MQQLISQASLKRSVRLVATLGDVVVCWNLDVIFQKPETESSFRQSVARAAAGIGAAESKSIQQGAAISMKEILLNPVSNHRTGVYSL